MINFEKEKQAYLNGLVGWPSAVAVFKSWQVSLQAAEHYGKTKEAGRIRELIKWSGELHKENLINVHLRSNAGG